MTVHHEIVEITPFIAAQMLRKNKGNRPLMKSRVAYYVAAMERGEWQFNGETIQVDELGNLLNGQHRLHAVVASRCSITVLLVSGVPRAAFATMDQGAKRNAGTAFAQLGEKNYNALAAALRLLFTMLETGRPVHGGCHPSAQQIVDLLGETPEMRDHIHWAVGNRWCKKHMRPAMTAFCRYWFSLQDTEASETFFDQLEMGANLRPGSPILALRDRLTSQQGAKEVIRSEYAAALTFKAFRLYCDGATIRLLRVRQEGAAVEKGVWSL